MSLPEDARARELVISLAILFGSYVAARLLGALLSKVLARGAHEGEGRNLNDRLVSAVRRPLTYCLFLVGAYVAVHRSPLPLRWADNLDATLFVLSAALVALGAIRSYGILLAWYTSEPKGAEGLGSEFGPLLSKIGKLTIVLIALITVLQRLGVNVESLVVSLGVGSLAVGLAAQDTLANMFAGFTLLLDRPFKVGDRIQLATGEIGDVVTIGIRATRLKTGDETVLVIPNNVLTRDRLVNQSQPTPLLTTRVDVRVAYGTKLAKVKAILAEAAKSSEYVDSSKEPLALVTGFGEFAVGMRIVFWAKNFAEQGLATDQVHERIYERFAQEGIEIPFPVRKILQEAQR